MTKPDDTMLGNPRILDLPATLDADDAAALIAQMSALPPDGDICLNAAVVATLSPGYLQILVSAFKTFPQLSVANASADFAEAFTGCGIDFPQGEMPAVDEPAEAAAPEPPEPLMAEPMSCVMPEPEPAADIAPEPAAAMAAEGGDAVPVIRTILTIDDSRTMRDMLNMALSGAGFTVVQAVDGEDGLTRLSQQPIDVIITDINMPKLDGYGVIRAVRSDPAYNKTPILVLSTESEQESKDIAKDAGATGWIVKPFDPAGLVNIVNSVCE
jgi:two-component system, chemotaxis family, chemotaxis protein CheY